MIAATSCAELPRPVSFASAVSIADRRPNPLTSDVASTPPAATPTPIADFLSSDPRRPVNALPDRFAASSAGAVPGNTASCARLLIPFVTGISSTYARAS